MKLQTKYFGEIEYDADDILSFPKGLYGFDTEQEFLLIPFDGSEATLLCLQSRKTPALAFILMDPFALQPDYMPVLQKSELTELGVKDSGDLCYYVMCVVKDPIGDSTVNLKCPVAINPETRVSAQVILDSDTYGMRHLLSGLKNGGRAIEC